MENVGVFVLRQALGRYLTFDGDSEGGRELEEQLSQLGDIGGGGYGLGTGVGTGGASLRAQRIVVRNVRLNAETLDSHLPPFLAVESGRAALLELTLPPLSRIGVDPVALRCNGLALRLALRTAVRHSDNRNHSHYPPNKLLIPQKDLDASLHFASEYLRNAARHSDDDDEDEVQNNHHKTPNASSTDPAVATIARLMDSLLNSLAFSLSNISIQLHVPLAPPQRPPLSSTSMAVLFFEIRHLSLAPGSTAPYPGISSASSKPPLHPQHGLSGVLDAVSRRQLSLAGLSVVLREFEILDDAASPPTHSDTHGDVFGAESPPLGSLLFESSLLVLNDSVIENLIHLAVRQNLASGAGTKMAQTPSASNPPPQLSGSSSFGSSYSSLASFFSSSPSPDADANLNANLFAASIPAYDLDLCIDSHVYSALSIDALSRLLALAESVKQALTSASAAVDSRTEDQLPHSNLRRSSSSPFSPRATNEPSTGEGSFQEAAEHFSDEPTSFRVQLRVPSYSAFLLSSRDTISAHIIDMLLEGDESKMTAAGLHHLKLDVSGFRLVLARDSRGRIRLELEIGKVDILELVVANDPAELDHAPLHEYTALLSLRGAQTSSRLHDRARTLYSQLDDMQTGSGGGGVRGPENVFRFGVPRSTAGRGGFGDRRGEDGAVGVRVRVDLATREARGRVGDVCMFVDVCRLQRTMDLVSEFLGTSGTGTGAGNKDEDCSESLFSDEEGHSTAPSTAERPIFMQLSIDLVRVWTFIPAMKLATKSRDGINPQKLVIDVLDTRVSLNDPNQTKISHVGHNVVTTATYIQIGGIGMSLATPVTLWREYNLVPLAFVGVLGSEPPAFCTLSVQTMRPSIISMASTVYYDGHEGYDDEVENDEVDEDLDEVEGQDEDAFGTKSWFNVDESLETEGAFKTPRARPSLSALEKARSRAMADSKTALLVHLNRIRVNLGKAEFDILMLLVNDLQLWLLSETASPEAPLLGDPVTQNDFDNEPASNNPFKLGLILQIDEIAVRLFSAFTPTGLEWAYNLNLADSRLVATFSANGDIKCNMELDNVSVTDVDGQFIILRSEVSDQRRPMTNLIFKSIFDKIINMKENTVSISLSEFRMMIVGETMALLQRDLQGFFQEPPGMMPVDAVDAVNNITVVLNRSLLDYRPLYRNFRAALVISKMKVLLNLIPHSPTMGVDLSFCDLMVYILKSSSLIGFDIDEQSLMVEKGLMSYLKECRYARVFSCDVLDLSFRQTQSIDFSGTKVEIGLSNSHAYLDCCLDSYRLLLDIAEYVASGGDSQHSGDIAVDAALMPEKTETRRKMSVNVDHNIMASVDEAAFTNFVPAPKVDNIPVLDESDIGESLMGIDAVEISDPLVAVRQEEIIVEDDTPFVFRADHLSLIGTPNNAFDSVLSTKEPPVAQVSVKNFSLSLRLFDGFDFPIKDFPDDDSDLQSSHPFEDSGMDDSSGSSPNKSRTLEPRSSECRIQVNVSKINVAFNAYPESSICALDLHFSVALIEVIDNVKTSNWRKFLTMMRPGLEDRPLQTESNMVVVEVMKVRPDLEAPDTQEIRLKVHVAPLRFFVDQDALSFIGTFLAYGAPQPPPSMDTAGPVVPIGPIKQEDESFFQICYVHPIPVKIDYKPKHVNLKSLQDGNLLEVFNFVPLEGSEMTLNQVRLTGVKGVAKLIALIRNQWLPDVTRNQYHRVVKGLSGVRPVANIGAGIADLVLLPWRQYQKEGKILRGLERGVKSFSKAAAMETLSLGTRLAVTTQAILEGAEGSTGGSAAARRKHSAGDMQFRSRLAEQPRDMREGMELAYQSFARNMEDAVKTVIDAPARRLQGEGSGGGAGAGGSRSSTAAAVVKAVPVAILRPMIGATEAVSKALLGIQNTIDPSKKEEMHDKYKD